MSLCESLITKCPASDLLQSWNLQLVQLKKENHSWDGGIPGDVAFQLYNRDQGVEGAVKSQS